MLLSYTDEIDASEIDNFPTDSAFLQEHYQPMDGGTNQRTDGLTDIPSYRDVTAASKK